MKKLLLVSVILCGCVSSLDKTSMRILDSKGQEMADRLILEVQGKPDAIGETEKARAFKGALRQQAINAGNKDLLPIED